MGRLAWPNPSLAPPRPDSPCLLAGPPPARPQQVEVSAQGPPAVERPPAPRRAPAAFLPRLASRLARKMDARERSVELAVSLVDPKQRQPVPGLATNCWDACVSLRHGRPEPPPCSGPRLPWVPRPRPGGSHEPATERAPDQGVTHGGHRWPATAPTAGRSGLVRSEWRRASRPVPQSQDAPT